MYPNKTKFSSTIFVVIVLVFNLLNAQVTENSKENLFDKSRIPNAIPPPNLPANYEEPERQDYFRTISNLEVEILQSAENDSLAQEIGNRINHIFNFGNGDDLISIYDFDSYFKKIAYLSGIDYFEPDLYNDLKNQFYKSHFSKLNEIILDSKQKAFIDLVNIRYDSIAKKYYALLRLLTDGDSFNYLEFSLTKIDSKFYINDIKDVFQGNYYSEIIAKTIEIALFTYENYNFNSTGEFLESMEEIDSKVAQSEFETAYHLIESLPTNLKNEYIFRIRKLKISKEIDNELFLKNLKEVIDWDLDDSSKSLKKINYDLRIKDYSSALIELNNIENQTNDHFLEIIRGDIYNTIEEYDMAQKSYDFIIKNFPLNSLGYFRSLDLNINTLKSYDKAIKSLTIMYNQGIEIEDIVSLLEDLKQDPNNNVDVFLRSKDYKNWKKKSGIK